jgi:glutamate--cysteine ligase
MVILDIIKEKNLANLLVLGQFGLEKENIRIDKMGEIASTSHPSEFGVRSNHPFITTDFAEAQIELITPICNSTKEAHQFMMMLHHLVSLELKDEYLWPYSQPPVLPENLNDVQIAQFEHGDATPYREYLSQKYGKYHQLLSGVHFNFSFTKELLFTLYQESKLSISFPDFINNLYLKVARFYLKHAWLIIYLTGTGYVIHNSYKENQETHKLDQLSNDAKYIPYASSKRNGQYGYQNTPKFSVSYNSLNEYIHDLEHAIDRKDIESIREFYTQVRLKTLPKTNKLVDIKKQGIQYLEIRTLDLDPSMEEGIALETLDFLHLFLIYGLIQEKNELQSPEDYSEAYLNQIKVSDHANMHEIYLEDNKNKKGLHQWGTEILNDMQSNFKELGFKTEYIKCIETFKNKLNHPKQLTRYKLTQNIKEHGYQNHFLNLSQHYFEKSKQLSFQLYGFEDLELSTQILLREAIKKGIQFEFLDREDNFIEFSNKLRKQMVKQATKTGLDNYISVLAMENKIVTKKLVEHAGLTVALGSNFTDIEIAKNSYHTFKNYHIVIKPNSTNFGTGITILKTPFTHTDFNNALEFAFLHDKQILIEHFFPGKEYRFLVIDNETVAVLHREPANIIGDGKQNIQELIEEKNKDSRRGTGYRKPLELITPDNITEQFLTKQKLTLKSIPKKDEKIYLRENSNISTGGDSIDYTDTMPEVYKEIAVNAAKSVDVMICGVDMIITNHEHHIPDNNYCIIELNFNPAIQMHTYPFEGKDRKIAIRILKCLDLL